MVHSHAGGTIVYNLLEFLEHLCIILLFPGPIRLVNPILHLCKRWLKHCWEVLIHCIDICVQLRQFFFLLLLPIRLFCSDFVIFLFEIFNNFFILLVALLQSWKLLIQFILSWLILSSHICDDIMSAFLIHFRSFIKFLFPRSFFLLLPLACIGLLQGNNQFLF